jgi:hypothetical protein
MPVKLEHSPWEPLVERWNITRRCYFSFAKVSSNSWQCLQQCLDSYFENIVMG